MALKRLDSKTSTAHSKAAGAKKKSAKAPSTSALKTKALPSAAKTAAVFGAKTAKKVEAAATATAAAQTKVAPKAKLIATPPDFVDIGLGPTGMMEMLHTIAEGRTALGVELRGDPILGVHQNIRVDWFHQLGMIDELMEKRYGADRIPLFPPTGKPFKLAEIFFRPELLSGAMDFPEIYRGDGEQNVGGRIHGIFFEDARDVTLNANGGKAKVAQVPAPHTPDKADPSKLRSNMQEVLDGPSTFQAAITNYAMMMRRYLELIEKQDLERGLPPRAQILTNTRVAQDAEGNVTGFVTQKDGNVRIIVEQVVDEKVEPGKRARRVRAPGTEAIDLGVPKLFSITEGAAGTDAKALGYEQHDVVYKDPVSGELVTAQQTWIAGEVSANVGGQLIRRVSTQTDPETGETQTVRQITVGHERADRIAWTLVQVPDFLSFDPIKAGTVPAGTSPKSPEFAKAAQNLVYHYYLKEAGAVLHIPPEQIREMRMVFGPNVFTLTERIGDTARIAKNGVVGGDLMGNGHFLTSGGAMTGMIGHGQRVQKFWRDLDKGMSKTRAMSELAASIKLDSEAWLHVSAKEFSDVLPQNFGVERARALQLYAEKVEAAKPVRHPNHGLEGVLGQTSWAKVFADIAAGKFGKPHINFYVPAKEVDVLGDSHLPTQNPFWVRTGAVPAAYHYD